MVKTKSLHLVFTGVIGLVSLVFLVALNLEISQNTFRTSDAEKPESHQQIPCDPKVTTQLLPEDEYPHNGVRNEWYYWTGHLETEGQRRFGYELVFFFQDTKPMKTIVAHQAITDIDGKNFSYTTESMLAPSFVPSQPLIIKGDNVFARLDGDRYLLKSRVNAYDLTLELESLKKPVLYPRSERISELIGGSEDTWYYSKTRLRTSGTIKINGREYALRGDSWFDHQWGNYAKMMAAGWDWFAIQTDDNREIVFYNIHDRQGGSPLRGGLIIEADCSVSAIKPEDIIIEPRFTWASPHSIKEYSLGWDVRINDLEFTIIPVLNNQEVYVGGGYWEGACEVSGDIKGRAYVELVDS